MISKEEIVQIAELAKLSVPQEKLEDYTEKLSETIKFIHKVKDVNTNNLEPTYQLDIEHHPLREDVVVEGLSREEVLKNTLEEQYGHFKILNVMD